MKGIPTNVSESFRKRNAHLYPVGAVEAKVPEPVALPALAKDLRERKGHAHRVRLRVSLVALRKRQLDSDNCVGSFKPMRDHIARILGIDDGDERIQWETSQVPTKGDEGVMVKIQIL